MAQQYSSAQSYSAQYPPIFSPFASAAGQQMGGGAPNYQQMNVHQNLANPSPMSNQMRYDANAVVQPQPAPLPFPSHFNPELLKHFPPPPIPPAHFAIHPGSAASLNQFPQGVNTPPALPQHSYTPFQQPTTPLNGVQSGSHIEMPTQDPRLHGQVAASTGAPNSMEQLARHTPPTKVSAETSPMGTLIGRSMDSRVDNLVSHSRDISRGDKNSMANTAVGARLYNKEHSSNNSFRSSQQQYSESDNQARALDHDHDPRVASQAELKERAKAALLSLVPHNIRYNDFLTEGVNAHVLQQLYEELGLNWQSDAVQTSKMSLGNSNNTKQQDGDKNVLSQNQHPQQIPSGPRPAVASIAKLSPAIASLSRPSPTASPSMERKDRIAQLLAAKAGKAASSTVASQSESPASVTDPIPQNVTEPVTTQKVPVVEEAKIMRPVIQTEKVRQKMEQLKRGTMSNLKAAGDEYPPTENASTDEASRLMYALRTDQLQVASLPTPIKEQIVRNGFASTIPGLFMTSDEMEEANGREQAPELVAPETSREIRADFGMETEVSGVSTTLDGHSPRSSRKRSRSTERSDVGEGFRTKLAPTGPEESAHLEMDMDQGIGDDASEGEIVEDNIDIQDTQDPTSENPNQNYHSKQTEISAMRKRIAEMEQRQTLKRSQSHALSPTESPISTPTFTQTPQTALNSPLSRFSDQLSTVTKQDDRASQPTVPLVKATPEQIAERAARLKADFLRQRALRQKQLQEGLPALNDEVTKSQNKLKESKARLAQVQGELQQYEADILRARETERQIRQEIESLEKSVSDGMSGQKQFSNELKELKQETKNGTASQPGSAVSNVENHGANSTIDEPQRQGKNVAPPSAEDIRTPAEDSNAVYKTITHVPDQAKESNAKDTEDAQDKSSEPVSNISVVDPSTTESASRDLENDIIMTETENGPRDSKISVLTNEDEAASVSNSDDSDGPMEESDDTESDDSRMSIDEGSDDSASMSNSDSEEYEPAEPEQISQTYTKSPSEDYEPDLISEQRDETILEDEGDEYEPADDMSVDNGRTTSSTSATGRILADPQATYDNQPVESSIPGLSHDTPQISATAENLKVDDQEKGLQLSEANTLTKSQVPASFLDTEGLGALRDDALSSTRYVPYQSPLSSFKSYRFHPSFSEQVKAGYRSLTYSHKIDPKLPMCLKELEGEPCTDPDCQDQHFGSMALSGM